MPQTIRVLLVEDHQLVAEGIQALLDRQGDIKVVGRSMTTVRDLTQRTMDRPPGILV